MKAIFRPALCAALLAAVAAAPGVRAQQAASGADAPQAATAKQVCAEARANILRARLTYGQKTLRDRAHISKIFAHPQRHNEYLVELRDADEWRKQYPDIWMQGFYAIANEGVLQEARIRHSVGDEITVHGTIADIDFINMPEADTGQPRRPACRLTVRLDWNQADK